LPASSTIEIESNKSYLPLHITHRFNDDLTLENIEILDGRSCQSGFVYGYHPEIVGAIFGITTD